MFPFKLKINDIYTKEKIFKSSVLSNYSLNDAWHFKVTGKQTDSEVRLCFSYFFVYHVRELFTSYILQDLFILMNVITSKSLICLRVLARRFFGRRKTRQFFRNSWCQQKPSNAVCTTKFFRHKPLAAFLSSRGHKQDRQQRRFD